MKTLTVTRERGQSGDRRRQIIRIACKKGKINRGGGGKKKKKKKKEEQKSKVGLREKCGNRWATQAVTGCHLQLPMIQEYKYISYQPTLMVQNQIHPTFRSFRLGLETIYCTAKRNETAPRNHT